ncbi:MAG: hypothetical protein PCFJNLEI_03730 [Verrucomicrobiae bacterium]|nr:hypothetical protein [Verrucomicrobiae bacterium]
MTTRLFSMALVVSTLLSWVPASSFGDQTINQNLAVLDEKVNRLNAQMEDLLVRYQQLQKDSDLIRGELMEFRRAGGVGVSAAELKALEDRIQAVDNARKADRQAIIEQLAKELAGLSSGKPITPVAAGSREHVVAKGDTLSSIAKVYKVTVTDLKKANGLTSDDIKLGQKLTIPK